MYIFYCFFEKLSVIPRLSLGYPSVISRLSLGSIPIHSRTDSLLIVYRHTDLAVYHSISISTRLLF